MRFFYWVNITVAPAFCSHCEPGQLSAEVPAFVLVSWGEKGSFELCIRVWPVSLEESWVRVEQVNSPGSNRTRRSMRAEIMTIINTRF